MILCDRRTQPFIVKDYIHTKYSYKVTSFDESVGPRHPGLCASHGKHTENAESDFHL